MAAGTMWPSSGPDSNFPSRCFWSSFFFFQGEFGTVVKGFPPLCQQGRAELAPRVNPGSLGTFICLAMARPS